MATVSSPNLVSLQLVHRRMEHYERNLQPDNNYQVSASLLATWATLLIQTNIGVQGQTDFGQELKGAKNMDGKEDLQDTLCKKHQRSK